LEVEMRLGIRRKLIGTLMLVGLIPLVMSLTVILGGGAVMQMTRIRNNYESVASTCAERIADTLMRDELKALTLAARDPATVEYVREQNKQRKAAGPVVFEKGGVFPAPSETDNELDRRWKGFTIDDQELRRVLHNPVADEIRRLNSLDAHRRDVLVTNIYGELIASDAKSNDYFQGDEVWWRSCFNDGKGRIYVSSIIPATATSPSIVELAIPIYETDDPSHPLIGIMKDKIEAGWILAPLNQASKSIQGSAQLIDMSAGKTVFTSTGAEHVERAEQFYLAHRTEPNMSILTLLFNDLVIGSSTVPMKLRNPELYWGSGSLMAPSWVVIVAKPSEVAMMPVYKAATLVAVIGVALILVLFILGIAISNREIIMPIMRLREATAAVGRGELNVRLLSDASDPTFRKDELGDLARDFDEMTRQLQKNVNQLARSNEAKRRFMELAGHELRTPVTYLVGVCQLAQRQLQQLSTAATDGAPETADTIALAQKNAAATQSALAKIASKTQRLSRIIDNLLKLVTNDQFTTRMNKTPVDMRALLLQVTSDHRPFIAERKQQLVVDVAENLPPIDADKDKLEDALTNLLSNAIRFSPDGSTIRVAAHEVVGDMLEILVEDSGPGIPSQDLANLFEPFYTGSDILHHHSGTFEFGSKGIGLGLAIVRRFIELHGGIVRAHTLTKPAPGSVGAEGGAGAPPAPTGTQFQILLPLNKDTDMPDVPPAPQGGAPGADGA
jgi:two-component system sensor histidine kinase BaeS